MITDRSKDNLNEIKTKLYESFCELTEAKQTIGNVTVDEDYLIVELRYHIQGMLNLLKNYIENTGLKDYEITRLRPGNVLKSYTNTEQKQRTTV